MGLFGNKKKSGESLHTLSEKDIQKRLYGRFRREQNEDGDVSSSVEDKSYHEPAAVDTDQQDLFQGGSSPTPVASDVKPAAAAKEKSHPELQPSAEEHSRIASWLKQENQTVENLSREASGTAAAGKPGRASSAKPPVNYGEKFGKPALAVLRIVGSVIVGLYFALDFRKPKIRRAVYVLGAACVLAGIFYAVHNLNLQREGAMKGGRPSAAFREAAQKLASPPADRNLSPAVPTVTADRTQAPAAKAEKKSEAPAAAAPAKSYYVIQVATYATEEDADRVAKNLSDARIESFTQSLKRPSGKIYYSVFAGRYHTYQDAENRLASFKQMEAAKPFQDAFVRSLNLD